MGANTTVEFHLHQSKDYSVHTKNQQQQQYTHRIAFPLFEYFNRTEKKDKLPRTPLAAATSFCFVPCFSNFLQFIFRRLSNFTTLRFGRGVRLLDSLFLGEIGIGGIVWWSGASLAFADVVACTRLGSIDDGSGRFVTFAVPFTFTFRHDAVLEDVSLLVDQTSAGFVARGEGDLAFERGDLLRVEQVTFLVAILDFSLADASIGADDELALRRHGDFGFGIVGDRRFRPVGGLAGRLCRAGAAGDQGSVVGVLYAVVSGRKLEWKKEACNTHRIEESVAIVIPGVEQLEAIALLLRPHVAIGQRGIQSENDHAEDEEHNRRSPPDERLVLEGETANLGTVKVEVDELTQREDGKVQRREIMMQKELASHEVERKVVECPSEYGHAQFKIEASERGMFVIIEVALPAQDGKALEGDVYRDRDATGPPDKRVTDQVNLSMVFAPEVDAAA